MSDPHALGEPRNDEGLDRPEETLTRRELVVRGGVLAAAPILASLVPVSASGARSSRALMRTHSAGSSTMTIAITGDPTTLDPANAADPTNTNELMCALHDTLMRWPVVGNHLRTQLRP